MKKKLLCAQLILAAMVMTACGAEGTAKLENNEKVNVEATQGVEQTSNIDKDDVTVDETEDSEPIIENANLVKPVFASHKSALFMLLLNDDDTLVPFIGEVWQDSENYGCTYQKILSQYYDEDNDLAASNFWVYQYDDNTVVTLSNEVVGAAGPNKPRSETHIYVYDLSSETGITVARHSAIMDKYEDFNSSNFTYGFTERKFYTGIGNSIGSQYDECDEQEFKDSISEYGLTFSGVNENMRVREDLDNSQEFDVPVIDSTLPSIFEMVGRNASFPEKVEDILEKYPIRVIEEE